MLLLLVAKPRLDGRRWTLAPVKNPHVFERRKILEIQTKEEKGGESFTLANSSIYYAWTMARLPIIRRSFPGFASP